MRFEWEDSTDIGHYECTLYDDSEKKMSSIYFWDYTCPHHQKSDAKNRYARPYSFEVGYCSGWSMHNGFDYDEEYNHHYDEKGRNIGGYQGNCTHTVAEIKRWCEEYLANMYIIDYDEELEELRKRKAKSDWFLEHGYTGEFEGKGSRWL